MSEITSIKKKIHALLSKTTENGCSEAEALAAAAKAGELMDHFNLTIADIDIKQVGCRLLEIELKTIVGAEMDSVIVALAKYCDSKAWFSRGKKGTKWARQVGGKYSFFGLETDILAVEYLYPIINKALHAARGEYKKTDDYTFARSKKAASRAFAYAFGSRISQRLYEMKAERDEALRAADAEREERTGRSLVLIKNEQVESEFADLGVSLHTRTRNCRASDYAAARAGMTAANKVNLNRGVGQNNPTMIG